MKRASFGFLLTALLSCSGPTQIGDLPSLTPFALTGVVANAQGRPEPGTYVELLEPASLDRIGAVRTDDTGAFRFQGVSGGVLLRVSKPGHFHESRQLQVSADMSADFTIRKLDASAA